MKYYGAIVCAAVISCVMISGCSQSSSVAPSVITLPFGYACSNLSQPCVTQTPSTSNYTKSIMSIQKSGVAEQTFDQPHPITYTMPVATIEPSETEVKDMSGDPVIGKWNIVGTPYSGTVVFSQDGSGAANIGYGGITQDSETFTWKPTEVDSDGNRLYEVKIIKSGNSANGMLYTNGTLTSSLLKSTNYLVKIS